MKRLVGSLLLLAACQRASSPTPPTSSPTATDVPAAQRDATTTGADAAPPPPAERSARAPARGASADPPLRALDPTMAVPRWQGEGELSLTLPGTGDGPLRGTLRVGDLTLRVRGYRSGETVRATLEPEAVDVDAAVTVWRGTLDATLRGEALAGAWTVSAEGGRLSRAGTVGAR